MKSELAEVKVEKAFAPTARVKIIEEEPQLFPEQGEVELPRERRAREEAQAMIQEEPEEPTRQRFIDKILGISRAKAKKPVKPVVVPKFDEIEDFAEKENDSEDDLKSRRFCAADSKAMCRKETPLFVQRGFCLARFPGYILPTLRAETRAQRRRGDSGYCCRECGEWADGILTRGGEPATKKRNREVPL